MEESEKKLKSESTKERSNLEPTVKKRKNSSIAIGALFLLDVLLAFRASLTNEAKTLSSC